MPPACVWKAEPPKLRANSTRSRAQRWPTGSWQRPRQQRSLLRGHSSATKICCVLIRAAVSESLSDQTGGFLIHDTNDLVSGLRRIDDDMNGYYFLTYVPQNKEYDGRFRRISVKVARPNVDVQSRQGYYAVESAGQLPILDYEVPAIAAARNWKSSPTQNFLHSARLVIPCRAKTD